MAYVTQGVIELRRDGGDIQRYAADESISLASQRSEVTFVNLSDEVGAKLITFTGQF